MVATEFRNLGYARSAAYQLECRRTIDPSEATLPRIPTSAECEATWPYEEFAWHSSRDLPTKLFRFPLPAPHLFGECEVIQRTAREFDTVPGMRRALHERGLLPADPVLEINRFFPNGGYLVADTFSRAGRGAFALELVCAVARETGTPALCVYTLSASMIGFLRKHGFHEPERSNFVRFFDFSPNFSY